jgi:hypothetical protein
MAAKTSPPTCTGRVPLKGDDDQMLRDDNGKVLTRPCENHAIAGGKVCTMHGGKAPQVKARAAVRAEVQAWGLGDSTVDPGEILLRLVSQSAARAERYSALLEEAYDAADRLKVAYAAAQLVVIEEDTGYEDEDDGEPASVQSARQDLDRIFNTGGVAALVGNTYDDADGSIYANGEAIRGLALLEAQERDRCAGFAAKAIAAGLAERTVRLAERQGEMIAQVLMAVFDDLDLTDEQRDGAPDVIRRHLTLLTG